MADLDKSIEAVEPLRSEAGLGELFSEMTSELSTLMRKEVELAKVETKEEASRAAKAGALLGGGGLAAWLGVLFASLAAAFLLDQALNRALAFLIVALVWLVAAAITIQAGRRRIKDLEVLPQTMETIKEDVAWAKEQKS